jgi:hypothetical protein
VLRSCSIAKCGIDQPARLHRQIERPAQRCELPIDLRRLRGPLRDLPIATCLLALTLSNERPDIRRRDRRHAAPLAEEWQQVQPDLARNVAQ